MSARLRDPVLTVDAVSKAFGDRAALRAVSLEVGPGEVYALLGPNGAGKSTLVRAVCGLTRPDAGAVRVLGKDPARNGAARAAIGLAPQPLALYPLLTVAENLAAFASLAGCSGRSRAAAVREAMRVTGVEGQAHALVRVLSGGFQRRVNVAAAILGRPRLLVLDEPTAGVDVGGREAMSETMRRLKAEGAAILLVTHDLEHAWDLADRTGFLRGGEKVLEGAPAALVADAFGERLIVELDVGEAPGSALTALAAEGFQRTTAQSVWSRLDADGYGLAARLGRSLAACGAEVRETRVRRPTLADLFARIAAPEPTT